DGILILDAETGHIVDVNPFLIELVGYSREQFIDKTIWDIGFFKDIIANRNNFLQLKEKKYIRYEDMPLETVDGRKIDVEFVSNVYQQNHHDVIQCNIRDITERKRTAAIIEAERERLAVTLRSIGDGVITTDTHGTIVIINKVAEELCGWKQAEAAGKPLTSIFNIINENTRKSHENPVEKVLATGEIIELENHTVIISRDGTERIIADSAAPIKDKNNLIIGVVLVFRDITEKQKLFETLQRNQKLESLGILAGGIAHDFNNLMGGIFGFVDMALEESKGRKVTQYLSKAMLAIDRARSLTQQLLTFAKGGAPVQKPTPLFPLIEETVQFALSGSNVSCRYTVADDLKPCIIDKNQICQVIENMIINAQQAMPMGGIVELSAANVFIEEKQHQILKKGGYVKVSIKDQGIGISKKILPRIFDPFFTTKPKGHGIGLTTCHSIITRHDGAIEVESVLDEGTTFHIYLPVSTDLVMETPTVPNIRHKGSGRFIVMDDEEVMLQTIENMLEGFGYSVMCKTDGKAALDLFMEETKANHVITGLILDLTVPGGMGGKDVVKEIRRLNTDIPVFVTSGYADDPIIIDPVSHGFTASICKPFRKIELAEMMEKFLK
ncbi:MAG: PAS domain S-box protein, partial [Chitinivibrionales bacterium]|nr:PAS domain S-box protein [Chitinivibrionales bacterium]